MKKTKKTTPKPKAKEVPGVTIQLLVSEHLVQTIRVTEGTIIDLRAVVIREAAAPCVKVIPKRVVSDGVNSISLSASKGSVSPKSAATRLKKLGSETLRLLEETEEWSPATLDDIAAVAFDLRLADTDEEGLFRVI